MSFILGFNIDHIATLRNARAEGYPDILELANIAIKAGANQITAHLREDRRHIKDSDIYDLKNNLKVPLNMEIAVTEEMQDIALKVKPHSVCLVPEKREEITTEGGLNLHHNLAAIKHTTEILLHNNIKVSLFVDPLIETIPLIEKIGPTAIEINTGNYANNSSNEPIIENIRLFANNIKNNLKISVHAGHGLNFTNIHNIAAIKTITEFNIGHFLVGHALKSGLNETIKQMINLIQSCR